MPVYGMKGVISFLDDDGHADPEIRSLRGTMNVTLIFEARDDMVAFKRYEKAAEHLSDLCDEGETGEICLEQGEFGENDFIAHNTMKSERLPRA